MANTYSIPPWKRLFTHKFNEEVILQDLMVVDYTL